MYAALAKACWDNDPGQRPPFTVVLTKLGEMLAAFQSANSQAAAAQQAQALPAQAAAAAAAPAAPAATNGGAGAVAARPPTPGDVRAA